MVAVQDGPRIYDTVHEKLYHTIISYYLASQLLATYTHKQSDFRFIISALWINNNGESMHMQTNRMQGTNIRIVLCQYMVLMRHPSVSSQINHVQTSHHFNNATSSVQSAPPRYRLIVALDQHHSLCPCLILWVLGRQSVLVYSSHVISLADRRWWCA